MIMKNRQTIGLIIVISCGIMWAAGGIFNQLIFMNSTIPTKYLCAIRSIISGGIVLGILFAKEKSNVFAIWKEKSGALSLIIFALIGVMGMQYTYSEAIRQSNAATATVLQYVYPIFMLIYAKIKTKRNSKLYEIIAIFVAFAGVVLIATHGKLNTLYITPLALLFGLLAASSYLFYTVYPDKLYKKYGILMVVGWAQLLGGLMFFFMSIGNAVDFEINAKAIIFIVMSIICGTLVPFAVYGYGVKILGGVKASLFVTVEPVVSAIMAAFVLKTTFNWVDILGFICILGAVETVAIIGREK